MCIRDRAHCSHGQEAFAVGEAYVLDTDDYSLGTHRAHAEVLARGMSAIRELPEDKLYKIMSDFKEGKLLRNVEQFSTHKDDVRAVSYTHLQAGKIMADQGDTARFISGGLRNHFGVGKLQSMVAEICGHGL